MLVHFFSVSWPRPYSWPVIGRCGRVPTEAELGRRTEYLSEWEAVIEERRQNLGERIITDHNAALSSTSQRLMNGSTAIHDIQAESHQCLWVTARCRVINHTTWGRCWVLINRRRTHVPACEETKTPAAFWNIYDLTAARFLLQHGLLSRGRSQRRFRKLRPLCFLDESSESHRHNNQGEKELMTFGKWFLSSRSDITHQSQRHWRSHLVPKPHQ